MLTLIINWKSVDSKALANTVNGKRRMARDSTKCSRRNTLLMKENEILRNRLRHYQKIMQRGNAKLNALPSLKAQFKNIVEGKHLGKQNEKKFFLAKY